MERLTTPKTERNREMICRYEDCDVCEEYCPHLQEDNCHCLQEILEKLGSYEDKQEQGLLIELPCKVGDTVYLINHFMVDRKKKPIKCIVDELTIDGLGCYAVLSGSEVFYAMQRFRAVSIKEFGKTAFTTQAKAEEALAKMGE